MHDEKLVASGPLTILLGEGELEVDAPSKVPPHSLDSTQVLKSRVRGSTPMVDSLSDVRSCMLNPNSSSTHRLVEV